MNPAQIHFILCLIIIGTNDVSSLISNGSEKSEIFKKNDAPEAAKLSDFAYVSKHSPSFVDKTHLIEDLFISRRIIVTAPRHFGKTLNLSMLKYFYELQVLKETGTLVTKADIHNESVTDTDNYKLFENLAINRDHVEFTKQHFGKYPVILLDFSLKTSLNSYEAVFNHIRDVIYETFKHHCYLINSTKLRPEEIHLVRKWCDDLEYKNFTSSHHFFSLFARDVIRLGKYLYKHFGRECIVLVDEYDAIYRGALGNLNETEFTHCRKMYQCLLEGIFIGRLETTPLAHGVMSGITHLAINDSEDFVRYIELNVFTRQWYGQDVDKYSDLHGFTRQEFDLIMDRNNIWDKLRRQASEYYNGYYSLDGKTQIFNPSSISKFIQSKIVKRYWTDWLFFEEHKRLLDFQENKLLVNKIISGENILVTLPGNVAINSSNVNELYETGFSTEKEYFPSLLFERGYLRVVEYRNRTLLHEDIVLVSRANEEMKTYLIEMTR